MNTSLRVLVALVKADFLERIRRSSFLVTLCLVIYIGYAVNTGQILVKLGDYRGVYNSAWVGSLMAVVISFFLGLAGFYLVKDTVERDERTGVGQILATTALTRPQYVLGKWLSNLAVLTSLVCLLALAAVLMQLAQREDTTFHLWALVAPFLFIALPMMALVSAFAVFFETVSWLKGGFGNLVYFGLFISLLAAGVFLQQMPWLDVIGLTVVGADMRAAARATFPDYNGSFTLAMISGKPLQSFVWPGITWTAGLIFQRLAWVAASLFVALAGALFFRRFDYTQNPKAIRQRAQSPAGDGQNEADSAALSGLPMARLTPLAVNQQGKRPFHANILRLAGLECRLLVKGVKWYWLAGMAALWLGCAFAPTESLRKMAFMLVSIWPVLVWSKMGQREARFQTGQLVFPAVYPLARLVAPAWLAGLLVTIAAESGVLLGRLVYAQPLDLLTWCLSVLFIPTLALALGVWGRSSKPFEVIYPILWYLGPFNPQNGLVILDYLGIHPNAPVIASPAGFASVTVLLLMLALLGRAANAQCVKTN